jgi:hypothetical protein
MRMAKALLASIPLGLVLVAAVIVPVALTPGTFGYHRWPTPKAAQVAERPVVPEDVPVVIARADRQPATAGVASRRVVLLRPEHRSSDRPRRAPALGSTPVGGRHGAGPSHDPAPAPNDVPAGTPATVSPATLPADGAEDPAPAPAVANAAEPPVLRDDPGDDLPAVDVPPPLPVIAASPADGDESVATR